jgi:hypothetical protein
MGLQIFSILILMYFLELSTYGNDQKPASIETGLPFSIHLLTSSRRESVPLFLFFIIKRDVDGGGKPRRRSRMRAKSKRQGDAILPV